MSASDLTRASNEIARRHRRIRWRAVSLLAVGALAGFAALISLSLALALAASLMCQAAAMWIDSIQLRELISTLAVEPAAYVIPEVESYGRKVAGPQKRVQIADGLQHVLDHAGERGQLVLRDRVNRYRVQLQSLASELTANDQQVEPSSVVMCERLLGRAPESPLYNWNVSHEQLGATLFRIRSSLHPATLGREDLPAMRFGLEEPT